MTSKAIDIVKPEPKDSLEEWAYWRNRLQSDLARLSIRRKRIEVKYEP